MKRFLKLRWIILTLVSASLALFWSRGWLTLRYQEYLINRTLQKYIKDLAPHLPFKIVSAKVQVPDLALRLVLEWQGHTLTLDGPLKLDFNSQLRTLTATYPARGNFLSNEFSFTTWATVDQNFIVTQERLNIPFQELGMIFHASTFKLSEKFLSSLILTQNNLPELAFKDLNLSGIWKESRLAAGAAFDSLTLETKNANPANVQIAASRINFSTPFSVNDHGQLSFASPSQELLQGEFHSKGGELLQSSPQGDFYLDFSSLQNLKTRFSGQIEQKKAQINVTHGPSRKQAKISISPTTLEYKLPDLDLPLLRELAQEMTQKTFLPDITIKSGTLALEGKWDLNTLLGTHHLQITDFKATHSPSQSVIDKLNLKLKVLTENAAPPLLPFSIPSGELKIGRVANHGLTFLLKPLQFTVQKNGDFKHSTKIEWEGLPFDLELGTVEANLLSETLHTSLKVLNFNPKSLAQIFCIPDQKLPPFLTNAQFNKITYQKETLDTDGQIITDFFGGKIVLDQISGIELLSPVPEIKFSTLWTGINLETITAWLKFGQIRGTLEGHLKEVELKKWLPTHFNFHIAGKPFEGENEIELDARAMKSFLTVVLEEEMMEDMLGSFAGLQDWLMFGGFKNFFGGYDLKVAAISAQSKDGVIHIDTHEQDVLKGEKNSRRYILYGDHFNMPLNKVDKATQKLFPIYSYEPLDIDATIAANYTYKMLLRFERLITTLAQKAELKNNNAKPSEQENPQDESPKNANCVPIEFQN